VDLELQPPDSSAHLYLALLRCAFRPKIFRNENRAVAGAPAHPEVPR
jgi:hypothetical protein